MSGTGETPESTRVITEQFVRERLGFNLAIIFDTFETDAAGIISFGEEMERLGPIAGYENVIGSLYFDEGKLCLGIFVRDTEVRRLSQD